MPWPPGWHPAGAGVEEGDEAVLLAGGEDRPVNGIVRGEGLHRGVELHSSQASLGNLRHLGDGHFVLARVHGAEPGEHVRVRPARLGDGAVGYARPSGRGLGVPRQQHRHHIQLAVSRRQIIKRGPLHRRPEVRLSRLDVASHAAVQPVRRGQVDMEIDGARRHRLIVAAARPGRVPRRPEVVHSGAVPVASHPFRPAQQDQIRAGRERTRARECHSSQTGLPWPTSGGRAALGCPQRLERFLVQVVDRLSEGITHPASLPQSRNAMTSSGEPPAY